MTDINTVMIVGRLVKNAEFRQIGGTTNCRFSLAVNRSRKNGDQWEDEVSYIDIQAWGKLAERMQGRLLKSTQVTVTGYLRQERWEQDGQQRSRLTVVADQIVPHAPKEQANGF